MPDKQQEENQSFLERQITVLLDLPWADMPRKAWETLQNVVQRRSQQGMYRVLEYESTLELRDHGKAATFEKRERVRYLRDNIIAYQDQAWGDGEILLNYRCTPGKPVDRYRLGHKTYILISRREVKNTGDVDEFDIEWGIRQGFLRRTEQWETYVKHPTENLRISVFFPKSRPPNRVTLIESNRQHSHDLGKNAKALPDGRWKVVWEVRNPRLHETYILQWEW